jgi:hypothetical protein
MKTASGYLLGGLLLLLLLPPAAVGAGSDGNRREDPWARLRQVVATPLPAPVRPPEDQVKKTAAVDPWVRLRQVVIPFAMELEKEETRESKSKLARIVEDKLSPWHREIASAARYFDIPEAIIKAVIMVESGGDPKARAGSTSASGLMQTIASTFAAARRDLAARGVMIIDDPCDPEASIMAGSWYLDRMFAQARADGKPGVVERQQISAWRYPLEYYYAGPGHGRKARSRVLIYRDGKKVIIDKRAYSGKVLSWAGKLNRRQTSCLEIGKNGGVS